MKTLKIILSENLINTTRISPIQFCSVRRYIKTARIVPPCVAGKKIRGKPKAAIKWLKKFMYKGFMYQNRVFNSNLVMEFKDIKILKEKVSICISS